MFGFLASLCYIGFVTASLQIVPGGTWTATNTGQHIQAHGAGIIKVGSTWYWVGENKLNGSAFQSVNCYSSTDLVQWTFVGTPLTLQASGDLGPNRVLERPKIIYNASTQKYVMWMHIDSSDYGEAKVGVATGDSVCGAYTYIGSFQPLGFQSRDMGLFQEDDGTAYLLTEDRQHGTRIEKLSSDYLSVAESTFLFSADYEAPALIKSNGVYFLFASQLTGWNTNDNKYTTATSLTGPWSAWANFAPTGSNTFNSQTTLILPVGDSFVYLGDRWVPDNLMASTYIWLPLTISGSTATLSTNFINWIIDPSSGAASAGPSETQYEGESAIFTGGAKVVTCSGCSGGSAAGYIGGSAGGNVTFNAVSSTVTTTTTIRVNNENGDLGQRYAVVTVNGQSQRLAFLPTPDGNTPESSSLTVRLNKGNNVIAFSGYNGGYAADIDRLMVPIS